MIVRRALALTGAVVVTALAGAAAARAAEIGANDDRGRYAEGGRDMFLQRMVETGLRQSVITVRWRPSDPEVIVDEAGLREVVPAVIARGLKVVLAVYPYPPREVESGQAQPDAFARFVARLAQEFPAVRQYVIGNEPNQPAFWRPQFDARTGRNVSAARFGPFLAAAYDALKQVDPALTVIGVGLSPRGNDRPAARSNVSTSPVRFLAALGAWYRQSGRTRPLMDGLSFHPYPNQATDSLERGYEWPNAGFADLARVKQAVWDAFDATPQPTTLGGMRLYLDEVGWQVDTSALAGYTGTENVRVTDEQTQARIYGELVRRAACDPDVAEVNFFGFYDDGLRDAGFQAALHRVDGTPRPSAESVRQAIAEIEPGCAVQPPPPWLPATGVTGAQSPVVRRLPGLGLRVEAAAGEGASVVACVLPVAPPNRYVVLRRSARPRTQPIVGCATGRITTLRPLALTLAAGWAVPPGATVVVRFEAEANSARVSAFTVAVP